MGAANKVTGNKITVIKVMNEKYTKEKNEKKIQSLSLRRFHKKEFSSMHLHIECCQGCFLI